MASLDAALLPAIKCSSCGLNVDIAAMGDHVCESPPPPPPKSPNDSPVNNNNHQNNPNGFARMGSKGRSGPPPRIDPSAANRPFLPSPPPRSKTTPLPDPPDDPPDDPLPSFPIPRTKSTKATSRPDVVVQNPSPGPPPSTAPIPPPKVDDDDDNDSFSESRRRHQREFSIDSKSSYRTSLASNYDWRRWTGASSRPSMASSSRFLDDVPPLPSAPGALGHARQDSAASNYSGFNFGLNDSNSYRDEIEKSGFSPFRDSSQPEQLHSRSPSHPSPFGLPDLPEERSPPPLNTQFNLQPSTHLHPPGQEPALENGTARKNSDANSDSPISVSNFARALGLDAESTAESSVASSDLSHSDRSGTSLSSLPSEASLSRRKPSDVSRLGPVVEEQQSENPGRMLGEEERIRESPTDLEPPRAPAPLFSPDSPTDPAIFQGGLSLVSDTPKPPETPQEPPPMTRSATTPGKPRPKGRCRGCGELIKGKSMSSADGRLTGKYHRACFVCYYCYVPFRTADFYVLDDRPYCAHHYHELNGSLCTTCDTGIEGEYLETLERRGRGVADRQKFHPDCLRCRACHILLKGDYFEWNGQVFCERDAYRAAWAPPSPRGPRRPPLPSPLSQAHHYPPPSPDGRPGLRPGPPYWPPGPLGPRRFPERRTTRLMMT